MRRGERRERLSERRGAGETPAAPADPGLLIYERLLPAVPSSVPRIRRELGETLACHGLLADRRADVALVVSEAATNAVLHAYRDTTSGPLYVAATLGGESLTVWISDFGCGVLSHPGSAGLGAGMAIMTRLSDDLQISSEAGGPGTCVAATFARVSRASENTAAHPHPAIPGSSRRDMLVDYLHALRAETAALYEDTDAVLAEADLAVARSRRWRRQRTQGL